MTKFDDIIDKITDVIATAMGVFLLLALATFVFIFMKFAISL